MSANIETMFYVREKPWHGLGTEVSEAPASLDALVYAGLDWRVEQEKVCTEDGVPIPGYKVNVRSTDHAPLGIVSDRYKVVQNEDAFQFTDDLLGEGVTYETAGALQGGRKVWLLARMPQRYVIAGDEITPYMVFMNSHDGSSGVKVAMTPIRVQSGPGQREAHLGGYPGQTLAYRPWLTHTMEYPEIGRRRLLWHRRPLRTTETMLGGSPAALRGTRARRSYSGP